MPRLAVQRRWRALGLLLAARFFSVNGHIVMLVAMAWLAVETTGSSLYGGLLIGVFLFPGLVVPFVGGPIIDRLSRRGVLRVVELTRAGFCAIVPLLALFGGGVAAWQMLVVTALGGACNAMTVPAYGALLAEISAQYRAEGFAATRATSMWQMVSQVGILVANAVGGVLVAMVGSFQAYWFAVATHLVSAGVLSLLAAPPRGAAPTRHIRSLAEMAHAWRLLRADRALMTVALLSALPLALIQASNVLAAPYVRQHLNGDVLGYSWYSMGFAAGALIAAVICLRLRGPAHDARWHLAAHLVIAATILIFVLMPTLPLAVAAVVPMALAASFANIVHPAYVQENTPDAILGRVLSLVQVVMSALALLFAVGAGVIGRVIGLQVAYASWSLLFIASSALLLRQIVSVSRGGRGRELAHVHQ